MCRADRTGTALSPDRGGRCCDAAVDSLKDAVKRLVELVVTAAMLTIPATASAQTLTEAQARAAINDRDFETLAHTRLGVARWLRREALECVAETASLLAGGSDRIDPTGAPIWLVPKTKPQPWWGRGDLGFCTCDGNDDCVDLILFGPCEGGTMHCDPGDVVCICYFPD